MYDGELQLGEDGREYKLDSRAKIELPQGMWIYELSRTMKPQATLEIGMAYGFSTLYFLAARHENNTGCHTAIDPFQLRAPGIWAGIGLRHARRVEPEYFRFIEEMSFAALVRLAREGRQFEIIFVDGDHKFDTVLIDFTLSAEICSVGGHIIFDDMWMLSIQCVVAFVRANRKDFVEVPPPVGNIAIFKRIGRCPGMDPFCEIRLRVRLSEHAAMKRTPGRKQPSHQTIRGEW